MSGVQFVIFLFCISFQYDDILCDMSVISDVNKYYCTIVRLTTYNKNHIHNAIPLCLYVPIKEDK